MKSVNNVLYLVSHPIQYQAPLLRLINNSPDINVTALFYWDKKTEASFDLGFGQIIQWDVPVLEGYPYEFLSDNANSTNKLKKLIALWRAIDPAKYDAVWTHGYADLYTFFSIIFAKLKGLKVFVRGESLFFPDEKKSTIKNIGRKVFFKLLDLFVDRYLAIGTKNREFYLAQGVAKEKIVLANYAVNNDFFYEKHLLAKNKIAELKSTLQLNPNRPIILYASKFITRKYPIDVLHAFQMMKNTGDAKPYLLFIGNGETFDAVKAEAQFDGESVRFLGFKNQSELPDYFALADILVLPSRYENWGLIVNEAMNAECAIVVSDHVGCEIDLVQQGINGYVFPARDIKKLSQHLETITLDRDLCERMKIKSREIISRWGLPETVNGLREALAACGRRALAKSRAK